MSNLPAGQNIIDEPSVAVANISQSTLKSPSPPTKQKESNTSHGTPKILINVYMNYQHHLLFNIKVIKLSPQNIISKTFKIS